MKVYEETENGEYHRCDECINRLDPDLGERTIIIQLNSQEFTLCEKDARELQKKLNQIFSEREEK